MEHAYDEHVVGEHAIEDGVGMLLQERAPDVAVNHLIAEGGFGDAQRRRVEVVEEALSSKWVSRLFGRRDLFEISLRRSRDNQTSHWLLPQASHDVVEGRRFGGIVEACVEGCTCVVREREGLGICLERIPEPLEQ